MAQAAHAKAYRLHQSGRWSEAEAFLEPTVRDYLALFEEGSIDDASVPAQVIHARVQ